MMHNLSAKNARQRSESNLVIYNEIDAIMREILSQVDMGNLQATINDDTETTFRTGTPDITATGTTMTTGDTYYNVWVGTTEDRKMSYEIDQVLQHFTNLGYGITAKKKAGMMNSLEWEVYW